MDKKTNVKEKKEGIKKLSFIDSLRALVSARCYAKKNRSLLIGELMVVARENMIEWASREDATVHSRRMKRVLDYMTGIDQEIRIIDQRYKDGITR